MGFMKVYVEETPAGYVAFAWTTRGIAGVTLPCEHPPAALVGLERYTRGDSRGADMLPPGPGEAAHGLGQALRDYFHGRCPDFRHFSVDFTGYTPFQVRVLQAVRKIPYGTVLSYGQVAALAGRPRACRATGGALHANRILYLVPCHRVIRSDGSLGGFGSGTDWKRRLLELEGLSVGYGDKVFKGGKACSCTGNLPLATKYDKICCCQGKNNAGVAQW